MAITANGKNITAVYANGTEILNVYVNGSLIWSKPQTAGTWKNAWSGLAYIHDPNEPDQEGEYNYTYTFTGMSMANISGKTTQVDAEYLERFNNSDTTYTLTAARNNNSETTNLPWSAGNVIQGSLSALQQSGSAVRITGSSFFAYVWGSEAFGYFTVKNIWYYDK